MAGGAPIGENEPYPDAGSPSSSTSSSSGGNPDPSSSSSSGSSSGGATSNEGPVNLRSGKGNNGCSVGAVGRPGGGLLAMAMAFAITLVRKRRAVR